MHHQAHVRLIDAHAESIGRGDNPQRSVDECLLRFLLRFRRQLRVIRRSSQPLFAQKPGQILRLRAGGAVGDSAAGHFRRKIPFDQLKNPRELFACGGLNDVELEVVSLRSAVKNPHLHAQLFPEVPDDISNHFGLCRGGQALDQRQIATWAGLSVLANESCDIAVVRTEVLPPFGQAVCFVKDPGADLALRKHLAHALVAKLFRRDEQNADVAEPHTIEYIRSLGHRQQAVDGRTGFDSTLAQALNLVLHQRYQWRDDDGQGAGAHEARQGGHLVAK